MHIEYPAFRSSVNCIHFLPFILTNENSVNKIRSLGVNLMLLGNQTQTGITCDQGTLDGRLKQVFCLDFSQLEIIAVSDSRAKGKDDFSSIGLKQPGSQVFEILRKIIYFSPNTSSPFADDKANIKVQEETKPVFRLTVRIVLNVIQLIFYLRSI